MTALDFYAAPGRHTDISDVEVAAADIGTAVEVVQSILVYDMVAKDFYDVDLTAEQMGTVHERDAAAILNVARSIDQRAVGEEREPDARVGGRCNTYTLMTVALLRSAGIPARARCGFATYFVPGYFEDHWVAEYWDAGRGRWTMVDAQLDSTWRRVFAMDPNEQVVEVGPEQFLTGGHAWRAWRAGELDADRCGLTSIPEHGAFWIAGNLRLDLAALNKVEMLPWDVWGLHWEPSGHPTEEMLATFDEVADLTVDPDANLGEIRRQYDTDHFRMNGTVFSAALGEFVEV